VNLNIETTFKFFIINIGIVGVNNFGIGGVNGHVLLEPNYKELDKDSNRIVDKIPRLVNVCARNEESLKELFDFIEKNPNKITRDFLALITDTMKIKPLLNSSGFPFRGLNESICYRIQNNNFFLIIRFNAYKESEWTRKI
jgi:hypothetical protein